MTDSRSWLVFGGIHLLNGATPFDAHDVLAVAEVPATGAATDNTVVVTWSDLGDVNVVARTAGGPLKTTGSELFDGMQAGAALRKTVGSDGPIVPLFHVSATDAGVHVRSQIRFALGDACFIRITEQPLATTGAETLDWVTEAVRLHAENFLFLNNHQRYYRKCFKDRELEYKYTLQPPVDVWTHTVELYRRLRGGLLPGYVMEYRDEFQAWDYLNHLFEVTGPEPERGYVSFIPTTDGKHLIKRKWYAEDTFDRRETHTYGVDVHDDGGFERWISQELGVDAVRLPSFRRARYDVNFESVRTGHVYGIFFDHCWLVDAPDVTLNQCELEYLRSRTVLAPDEAAVTEEMAHIAAWLEDYLREQGMSDVRGFYSKRTFLKDAVAARPHLAREVSARKVSARKVSAR